MYVFPEFPRSLQRDEFHFQRYIKFIDDRSRRIIPEGTYTEKHHKVPKSFEGSDQKENIIRLTAREHFIAHLLLWKAFGGKMTFAFHMMYSAKRYKGKLTSRQYGELKKAHSIEASKRTKGKKIVRSEEWLKNVTAANKRLAAERRSKGVVRRHTPEAKRKMSIAQKGKKMSEERKAHLSKINRGKKLSPKSIAKMKVTKAANKREVSLETRAKLAKANTGKKHSEETKQRLSKIVKNHLAENPRPKTEEAKRKQSESMKKRWAERKRLKELENAKETI